MERARSTKEVAELLGIPPAGLAKAVWTNRIQAPGKGPGNAYQWGRDDVLRAGWVMLGRDVSDVLAKGGGEAPAPAGEGLPQGLRQAAAAPDDAALPHTDDQRQLRAAARAFARKKFSGPDRFVSTPALGGQVEITRGGIDKATSHPPMTREQFLSVTVADDLLRNATLRSSAPDREGRPNVRFIHTLDSKVLIDGRIRPAKITVREMSDGHKYYDQHTLDTEKAPAGVVDIDGSRRSMVRPSAGTSSTNIIGTPGPEVNSHEANLPKPGGASRRTGGRARRAAHERHRPDHRPARRPAAGLRQDSLATLRSFRRVMVGLAQSAPACRRLFTSGGGPFGRSKARTG